MLVAQLTRSVKRMLLSFHQRTFFQFILFLSLPCCVWVFSVCELLYFADSSSKSCSSPSSITSYSSRFTCTPWPSAVLPTVPSWMQYRNLSFYFQQHPDKIQSKSNSYVINTSSDTICMIILLIYHEQS